MKNVMGGVNGFVRRLAVRPWFPDGKGRMSVESLSEGLGLSSTLPILTAIARNRDSMEPVLEGEGTSWVAEKDAYLMFLSGFDTPKALALAAEVAQCVLGNPVEQARTMVLMNDCGVQFVQDESGPQSGDENCAMATPCNEVKRAALMRRINRKLAHEERKVVASRVRELSSLGRFHVVDVRRNIVADHDVNLAALARALGVLHPDETLEE